MSTRTSSLKLPEEVVRPARGFHAEGAEHAGRQTNHTIFVLSLVVLHEMRLAEESTFWGYLQSLPREVDLPLFWGAKSVLPEEERLDGLEGSKWLCGTEAGRDLLRKEREGMGLVRFLQQQQQQQDVALWYLFCVTF